MDLNHTLQKKRQNLFEHDHVITSFAFLKEHTCRSVYMYMYVVRSCTNFQSYVFCLYICKWFGPRSGLTKYLADLDTKTFSKNTRVISLYVHVCCSLLYEFSTTYLLSSAYIFASGLDPDRARQTIWLIWILTQAISLECVTEK